MADRIASSWWSKPGPLVIAHRGACLRAPENTLAAFRLAMTLGADGVELDAKLTSDGAVVIMHDATLDRTTDGAGPVAAHSLAEIKSLDAGSKFAPRFAGEPIPTLHEVFAELGDDCLINVELTNYTTPRDDLVPRVIDLVRRFGAESRVLLSSFHPLVLRKARRVGPALPLGLLLGPRQPGWMRTLFPWISPHEAYHLHDDLVAPGEAQRTHRAGRRFIPWTANDPARIHWLFEEGADAIITDAPDLALEIRHDVAASG